MLRQCQLLIFGSFVSNAIYRCLNLEFVISTMFHVHTTGHYGISRIEVKELTWEDGREGRGRSLSVYKFLTSRTDIALQSLERC